ncbi:MAG TPA: 2-oxo acid dehydrogenase subunit E2, partial [Agriterribacter sp.]|nr:2-oxo acid dehydrogenase subunit E2 [Agriterribacter sp.]
MIDIKVPAVGESISEVTLLKWVKPDGAYVERDEVIAELESEKATFEVNAEKAGTLKTLVSEGDTIAIGSVLATIDEQAAKPAGTAVAAPPAKPEPKAAPEASKPAGEAKAAGKGKIEVKVPVVGESISEVTLLKWAKNNGDLVRRDEVIAELESEKATFELNAEEAGQLTTSVKEGDTITIGDVIAVIDTDIAVPAEQEAPAQQPAAAETKPAAKVAVGQPAATHSPDIKATPVAAAIIADKKMDPATITASGTAGRIVKGDVLAALANPGKKAFGEQPLFSRNVRSQKMTSLRKTISRRLVESKNTTGMLTTFNEVDMTRIMEARKAYKDKFKETHGVGLGFMSFFAKACAIALSEWPAVNANLDGEELVYHDYADI